MKFTRNLRACRLLCFTAIGALARSSALAATADHASAGEQLFIRKVWPLLQEKCLACHGAKKIKSGFDMRERARLFAGGESGEPAIVAGASLKSALFLAVTRTHEDWKPMPPKENDALSAEQVELIRNWIDSGAAWKDPVQAAAVATGTQSSAEDGVLVETSGGLTASWNTRRYKPDELWAWQPVARPTVPQELVEPERVRNVIDAFIQAKLKERGVAQIARTADKRTLIRRATFDLTGLPPSPDEVAAFVQDSTPDAFERVVARLLNSPHYGEQQARHWLDVVRYADTSGFSNDFERPNAWRYRDYVVRAFNADKPYDRFIIEQIAGDELGPDDPELLIATGFLRMGPWEHTAMTVAAVTRQDFLDDVTHSVGVTFLGQGLRCARCHDHKFDPVPTRDYYRVQAVFAATHFADPRVPFLPAESTAPSEGAQQSVQARLQEAIRAFRELGRKNRDAVTAYLRERAVQRWEDLPKLDRPNKGELGLSKDELSARKIARKRADYFERELRRFEPFTFSVYSGPPNNYVSTKLDNPPPARRDGVVPAVRILTGGALDSPAAAVTPGVLSAMAAANDAAEPTAWNTIPSAMHGRRLAFAHWIASRQNTLAARVIVNRVWQWHFGRGLVATPNNFGKMGLRPSHPELLDWLTTWFVEHGWSLKRLHALIMSSTTYQQAGAHPNISEVQQLDVKNELLAFFPSRRLEAEELRDAMLAASGELNRMMGGPGVFPEINWEVAFQPRHIMGSVAPAYLPSRATAERNRRTLYAFRLRTLSDPMLEVFNRPGSETSCERRDETTVTPQAFALLNSHWVHARALAFAAAVEKRSAAFPEQLKSLFERVYARAPSDSEAAACARHYRQMLLHHRRIAPEPRPLPTKVARHMVEEMTGEDVHWEEELTGLQNYERDLMPWEVAPETRALAEVCLVLLNSNEFLYVR